MAERQNNQSSNLEQLQDLKKQREIENHIREIRQWSRVEMLLTASQQLSKLKDSQRSQDKDPGGYNPLNPGVWKRMFTQLGTSNHLVPAVTRGVLKGVWYATKGLGKKTGGLVADSLYGNLGDERFGAPRFKERFDILKKQAEEDHENGFKPWYHIIHNMKTYMDIFGKARTQARVWANKKSAEYKAGIDKRANDLFWEEPEKESPHNQQGLADEQKVITESLIKKCSNINEVVQSINKDQKLMLRTVRGIRVDLRSIKTKGLLSDSSDNRTGMLDGISKMFGLIKTKDSLLKGAGNFPRVLLSALTKGPVLAVIGSVATLLLHKHFSDKDEQSKKGLGDVKPVTTRVDFDEGVAKFDDIVQKNTNNEGKISAAAVAKLNQQYAALREYVKKNPQDENAKAIVDDLYNKKIRPYYKNIENALLSDSDDAGIDNTDVHVSEKESKRLETSRRNSVRDELVADAKAPLVSNVDLHTVDESGTYIDDDVVSALGFDPTKSKSIDKAKNAIAQINKVNRQENVKPLFEVVSGEKIQSPVSTDVNMKTLAEASDQYAKDNKSTENNSTAQSDTKTLVPKSEKLNIASKPLKDLEPLKGLAQNESSTMFHMLKTGLDNIAKMLAQPQHNPIIAKTGDTIVSSVHNNTSVFGRAPDARGNSPYHSNDTTIC